MMERNISLTPAEWNLMECLWEAAPRTGRETVEYMRAQVGTVGNETLSHGFAMPAPLGKGSLWGNGNRQ